MKSLHRMGNGVVTLHPLIPQILKIQIVTGNEVVTSYW